MPEQSIYYLPGRGAYINSGLGLELSRRGFDILGREIAGRGPRNPENLFASLPFSNQIDVIKHDLEKYAWLTEAIVIGNSFGAYLLAHSFLQLKEFPGRVLLISPVLGAVYASGMLFRPPQSNSLSKGIAERVFPDINLDILVGSDDEHFLPDVAKQLNEVVNGDLTIADNQGHRLEHATVSQYLDHWLPSIQS